VGSIEQLIGSLLSALHGVVRPPVCRNDWLSTISLLGGIVALLPVLAAVLIALIRKGTGNRYNVATGSVFGTIGVVCCFGLPWLAFRGASGVFRDVANGGDGPGLSFGDVASIGRRSCFVDNQRGHLGAGRTVYRALTGPHADSATFGLQLALLVGAPILTIIFVMLQGRVALRRGQKWPGRFLWVPVVGLVAATAPLRAGVTEQLWLGVAPVSAVGILIVFFFGKPRWSVINRSGADRARPPSPAPAPPLQAQPQQTPQHAPLHVPANQTPSYNAAYNQPQGGYNQAPLPYGPRSGNNGHANGNGQQVKRPQPLAPTAQLTAAKQPTAANDGRFQRVRTLGSGGFGTVWLAMDTHLNRTVAVKFAHVPDEETEQRIRREARALAAVRHPNCVRIYDIVVEPDGVGLVMEYIEGALLADVVRHNGRMDDVAAARLWLTMAGALEAAHAEGVLHRDVKPSNVIVDQRGTPHLIDFGIARSTGDNTLTGTGMMVGTPDYLAPEIARNGPPTTAADCWQLAATVSYALSSKPPRGKRTNVMSSMMAAAQQEPCTELPTGSVHARLLSAALDNDPAQRPTLATIRREISGWLARTGHAEEGPVAATEVIQDGPADRTVRQ
jgi:hypothetical protein